MKKGSYSKRKILGVFCLLFVIFLIAKNDKVADYGEDELVGEFSSPTGSLKLYLYQGPPKDAIMVDFYVIGEIQYMKTPLKERAVIYYRYHEEFEECYWNEDEHVVINGVEINIKDKKTWVYDKDGDY